MNLFNFKVKQVGNLILFSIFSLLLIPSSKAQNCDRTEFRTIDGSCNNLTQTDWGKADVPFLRVLPAAYKDGRGEMVTNRPNPREISNSVFQQVDRIRNNDNLSSFVFTWGQFLDHDVDITHPDASDPATIPLPANEPDFTHDLPFSRSAVIPGTGVNNSREHANDITAWIDASMVYGSDEKTAKWLRTLKRGQLKTSKGNFLPYNTTNGQRTGQIDPTAPGMADPFRSSAPHFVAGDVRASEQPGLTILHTLFVREHNRICNQLWAAGMRNDERIYQTARKQVGALIQHITYTEFLPALGIKLSPYRRYNKNVQPDILHVFATAAYRVGHTMVTEEMVMMSDNCEEVRHPLSLGEAFFNSAWIEQYGIAPIIKGLASQKQELINAQIVNSLRNSLFNSPRMPGAIGMDLASINIQRGRDHGLPDYNTYRAHFTGKKATRFTDITSNRKVAKALSDVYKGNINNIDPWVGMLAEEHYRGGNVGVTIYHILKEQFERLRDGDYYYYEHDPFLSKAALRTIKQTRLSDVIENNTPYKVQNNVFKVNNSICKDPEQIIRTCQLITTVDENNNVSITKPDNAEPYFQIFNASWRSVYSCMRNCGPKHEIRNLKKGTYRMVTYDRNRRVVCSKKLHIKGKGKNNLQDTNSEERSAMPSSNSAITVGSNIFPNPAKQVAHLTLKNYIGRQASITIHNNFGQIVQELPTFEINEPIVTLPAYDLTAGIYYVQIVFDDNTMKTHKMIIQE